MQKVMVMLNNGKEVPLKRKIAEHLEKRGKAMILDDFEKTEEVKASAAVQDEAASMGVDLSSVAGSGKDGRILKRDLQEYRTRMMTAQ